MHPGKPRCGVDGWVRALDGAQRREELAAGSGVDPAPHLACVVQVPIHVHRHDQRAQVLVSPLSLEPADHHQLLLAPQLDLQPGARSPTGLVDAVPALGDDPLQLLLPGRLQERLPVTAPRALDA